MFFLEVNEFMFDHSNQFIHNLISFSILQKFFQRRLTFSYEIWWSVRSFPGSECLLDLELSFCHKLKYSNLFLCTGSEECKPLMLQSWIILPEEYKVSNLWHWVAKIKELIYKSSGLWQKSGKPIWCTFS